MQTSPDIFQPPDWQSAEGKTKLKELLLRLHNCPGLKKTIDKYYAKGVFAHADDLDKLVEHLQNMNSLLPEEFKTILTMPLADLPLLINSEKNEFINAGYTIRFELSW